MTWRRVRPFASSRRGRPEKAAHLHFRRAGGDCHASVSDGGTAVISETEVEFPSQGAALRGALFLPPPAPSRPATVIMAHGTSATIGMVANEYARVFCRSGLAVLLYDHRNFGRSDGEPRQEINPWIQCRGYLDAMDFVETLKHLDGSRLALWGDSFSGGEVVVVGACDSRVGAIVAQCPVFGSEVPSIDPSEANFTLMRETLLGGEVRGTRETTTGPLPVVSSDQAGTPSLLEPIQAFRWFIDYGGRPDSRWLNRVTRVVPPTPIPYSPVLCAPFVGAPILMMVAPEDEMVHANYAVAQHAYRLMPQPKQWYDIRDGHFGLVYYPGERFDEASRVQAEFLSAWLKV